MYICARLNTNDFYFPVTELTVEFLQPDLYVHIRCVTVHGDYEALSHWGQINIFINHVSGRFTRRHEIQNVVTHNAVQNKILLAKSVFAQIC
jgi:hypothetical protein